MPLWPVVLTGAVAPVAVIVAVAVSAPIFAARAVPAQPSTSSSL